LGRDVIASPSTAAADAARFADAHRALVADSNIQFSLHRTPPPEQPPAWLRTFGHWLSEMLKPVGRFFAWIGSLLPDAPYARILMWTVLIAAALALLWMLFIRLREGTWRLPRRRRRTNATDATQDPEWQPEAAPARAWLEEADALAEHGDYAAAAHHLLMRSVEDIGRRRPGLVRPALTSRDLAASAAVPARARELFAHIARVVERSLFGGRDVSRDEWTHCREAYADFARAPAWSARTA
jgi:hypothetical protein